MLKRSIITIVAAACLALPLAACAAKPTQVMVPPTATPIPTTEPSATATVTSTPAPTPTATPITFESTVITSIMCQTGPGEDYTRIGYLKEGEVYTTYARDSGNNYFLISFPGDSSKTCWVWKNYIRVDGNSYTLPVATAEPETK